MWGAIAIHADWLIDWLIDRPNRSKAVCVCLCVNHAVAQIIPSTLWHLQSYTVIRTIPPSFCPDIQRQLPTILFTPPGKFPQTFPTYTGQFVSRPDPSVGPGCVLCTRIDQLSFLAGCRRRRLNQGLVVALDFSSLLDRVCLCVVFRFMGACFVYFVIFLLSVPV